MLLLLMIPFHLHWFTWVWSLVIPLTTSALCSVPSQAAMFRRGWHSIPLLGARTQLLHRSVTRCPSLLSTAHDLEGPVTRSPHTPYQQGQSCQAPQGHLHLHQDTHRESSSGPLAGQGARDMS